MCKAPALTNQPKPRTGLHVQALETEIMIIILRLACSIHTATYCHFLITMLNVSAAQLGVLRRPYVYIESFSDSQSSLEYGTGDEPGAAITAYSILSASDSFAKSDSHKS